MKEKVFVNLEDLMVSSVIMYVIDKKSRKQFFYKNSNIQGECFKEYVFRIFAMKNIEIRNEEYFNFDIVGNYFDKMSESYVDEFKKIDNVTTVVELTKRVREDLRFFMSKRNNMNNKDVIIFG